jgi:hypothetical protein
MSEAAVGVERYLVTWFRCDRRFFVVTLNFIFDETLLDGEKRRLSPDDR